MQNKKLKYILSLFLIFISGMVKGAYTPVDPTSIESVYIYNDEQKIFLVFKDGQLSYSKTEQTAFSVDKNSDNKYYTISTNEGKILNTAFQGLSGLEYKDWCITSISSSDKYYSLASRQLESNAFAYLYYSPASETLSYMSSKPAAGFANGRWQFIDPSSLSEQKLELEDEDDKYNYKAGTYSAGNITYTRTGDEYKEGIYVTTCLPFNLDVSSATCFSDIYVPINIAFYNTSSKILQLFLVREDETVTAGTPFIGRLSSAAEISVASNEVISYSEDGTYPNPENQKLTVFDYDEVTNSSALTNNPDIELYWCGTLQPTDADEKMMSFGPKGEFDWRTSTDAMPPFRAYLLSNTKSLGVKGVEFNFGDLEDNVKQLLATSSKNKVYNLRGQKLNPISNIKSLPKGIYIVNGKKVVR